MFNRKTLWIGSLLLGVLGFSPFLLSLVNKGDKDGNLTLNSKYYASADEELFLTKNETKAISSRKHEKNATY
ncbi:hypothetical protein [Enterococcus sp. LJL90]